MSDFPLREFSKYDFFTLGTDLEAVLPRVGEGYPGCYALLHCASGQVFFGSSGYVPTRLRYHFTKLAAGTHPTFALQRLYDLGPMFEIYVCPMPDSVAAREKEFALLKQYKNTARAKAESFTHVDRSMGPLGLLDQHLAEQPLTLEGAFEGFRLYAPTGRWAKERDPLTHQPSCYVVMICGQGVYYVGSTRNTRGRVLGNLNVLSQGKHKSELLQRTYNQHPQAAVYIKLTRTLEQAQKLEQELVTLLKDDPLMSNRGRQNVLRPRTGLPQTEEAKRKQSLAMKGRKRPQHLNERHSQWMRQHLSTEEGRAKLKVALGPYRDQKKQPVEVNGMRFDSLLEASQQLSIAYGTLKYRCKSPRFMTYRFLDKAS